MTVYKWRPLKGALVERDTPCYIHGISNKWTKDGWMVKYFGEWLDVIYEQLLWRQ